MTLNREKRCITDNRDNTSHPLLLEMHLCIVARLDCGGPFSAKKVLPYHPIGFGDIPQLRLPTQVMSVKWQELALPQSGIGFHILGSFPLGMGIHVGGYVPIVGCVF